MRWYKNPVPERGQSTRSLDSILIRAGEKNSETKKQVCSDIENDLAEDLGGEVGQSEASLIGYDIILISQSINIR